MKEVNQTGMPKIIDNKYEDIIKAKKSACFEHSKNNERKTPLSFYATFMQRKSYLKQNESQATVRKIDRERQRKRH